MKLYQGARQGVTFPLTDALCWMLASRQQILDVLELEQKGPLNPVVAEGLEGTVAFFADLAHLQAARAAGEVGRICAEMVFVYMGEPAAEAEGPAEAMEEFTRLRSKVDAGLTGFRIAKDRAARALTEVMIPAAPDYPT